MTQDQWIKLCHECYLNGVDDGVKTSMDALSSMFTQHMPTLCDGIRDDIIKSHRNSISDPVAFVKNAIKESK